jgi:hypothetical protein
MSGMDTWQQHRVMRATVLFLFRFSADHAVSIASSLLYPFAEQLTAFDFEISNGDEDQISFVR